MNIGRSPYFLKPEAALQRAQDFLSVGKEEDALNSLRDMIKDRRYKQWSQVHETIMLKYVELCVNLKNSALAKEGLYHYRLITQQIASKSLELVIERFLSLAEQKTQEAQKSSIEKIEEIDDLDTADAPEMLLLSVVSGAAAQDRMDRTVLSPWLRFLWDAYRNSLDLVRNNVYVEQLYHQIARQSFTFCKQFQRRNEFRKLCDMLRLHLGQIQKANLQGPKTAAHSVKLTNIDSLTMMTETRLIQLDTAIAMELWQEAFKSAEDLHNIMQLSKDTDKKIVRPINYVNYFDKIALVFWKGSNTLFHAAALIQKFNIYKDMKKTFSDEEALDQATRVLLAVMSIPEGADNPTILTKLLDIEEQHHTNTRILSTLLRLPIAPTRLGIIKEIERLNIPELAHKSAYNLYRNIEIDFNPLRISTVIQENLDEISKLNRSDYDQYREKIKYAVSVRVLKQLSLMYDSLSLKRFNKILPFYGDMEFERFLADASKNHSLKAQINHRDQFIHFGPIDATLAGDIEEEYTENSTEIDNEGVQTHLQLLHIHLKRISVEINSKEWENRLLKSINANIQEYIKCKESDHENNLMRRKKIESYKEYTENIRQEKYMQEVALQNQLEEQRKEEEKKRIEQINKENEKRRRQAEQEEIQRKIKTDQIKKFQSTPLFQQIIKEKGEEVLMTMDPEAMLREQRLRMDAERKEQQARLQQQEKKFDYLVRAFHCEEVVLRKQISDERQKTAPEIFDTYETRRIDRAIKERNDSFVIYDRLMMAKEDAKKFIQGVIKSHGDDLRVLHDQWERNLEQARKSVLQERKEDRKKERRLQAEQKKLEERLYAEQQQRLAAEKKLIEQQQQRNSLERQQQPQNGELRRIAKPPGRQNTDGYDSAKRADDGHQQDRRKGVEPEFSRELMRQRQTTDGYDSAKRVDDGHQQDRRKVVEPEFSRELMRQVKRDPPTTQQQQTPSPTAEEPAKQAPDVKPSGPPQPSAGKYIPPHLRTQLQAQPAGAENK